MSKKKDTTSEPPSLFDNLDLFTTAQDALRTADEPHDTKEDESDAAAAVPPVPSKPARETTAAKKNAFDPPPPAHVTTGLTGRGPLRDLFDFNFRQYSAYVICSRAIPAVEDGLKPV